MGTTPAMSSVFLSSLDFRNSLIRSTISIPNTCMAMVMATNKAPQKTSSEEITYTGSICKKYIQWPDFN